MKIQSPHPLQSADSSDGETDGDGPLSSLRVVDLTDIRGAMCARILADLGADVVRIAGSDPPETEPFDTFAYRYRNANKRSAFIQLRTDEGRKQLHELLAGADIFVENLGADERHGLGLAPDEVALAHPSLVHVSLADLGLTGPRAGWRLEPLPALAASGALHSAGFPDLPPCNAPGNFAHDCASVYGAVGAVLGLLDRDRRGLGQSVEISVQEAALAGITPWSIAWEDYLRINPSLPADGRRNADGSYWVLPAKDGWVRAIIGPRHWDGFLELLGRPEALEGPEWADVGFRLMNSDVVRVIALDLLCDRSRAELFEQALALGIPVGVIQTVAEFVGHPQTVARKYFAETGFPHLEARPFATHPVHLSRTAASIRRPAPESAGDPAGVFSVRDEVNRARPLSSGSGLLLEGFRIVEFGVAAVIPELCGLLSELGAEVIKIESLAHPDVLRAAGGAQINCSFAFNTECRGRKSVALDLSTEGGRKIAMDLCAGADVVAENYRGGVLDGLGLGYVDVVKRNPDVIFVSSQGYGRGGPLGEMPAFGPLNLGFTGIHLLWNHPDAPYPCGTTLNHPDSIAGKLLAVAVLAALRHRAATGDGQHIEMAQTEVVAYLLGEIFLEYGGAGSSPQPVGNRNPSAAPHGVYPSAGTDRWVAIAVSDDAEWQRMSGALDWPEHPEFETLAGRLARQDELDDMISAWTRLRSSKDIAELLQSRGVSAMPVMGPRDHHADPHLTKRNFIVHLQHPEVGPERHAGNPIRMSRLPLRIAESAPCLGADTQAVLVSTLGMNPQEVEDLQSSGISR